jgi:hypothetical protein
MTAKDKEKKEAGKTPAIRDLSKDEIDSVSGGASSPPPGWVDPDPSPKSPRWIDPTPEPKSPR